MIGWLQEIRHIKSSINKIAYYQVSAAEFITLVAVLCLMRVPG